MPQFVPVHDPERPRCEQDENDEEFKKHRQFDNPFGQTSSSWDERNQREKRDTKEDRELREKEEAEWRRRKAQDREDDRKRDGRRSRSRSRSRDSDKGSTESRGEDEGGDVGTVSQHTAAALDKDDQFDYVSTRDKKTMGGFSASTAAAVKAAKGGGSGLCEEIAEETSAQEEREAAREARAKKAKDGMTEEERVMAAMGLPVNFS
uniref:Uncharacterized protein n=1 Tax=Chromera velia CCMP2878 TaxID=1169474 RepID=A0A0G4HBP5_9ALVE|mmetsp:Transcript_49716/g.97963  ORF Transcript_49716/g.97963 Transcript_49716/m.97963 type:complete len:206 (+) Transcript_49716:266-883(+)|eukprot:Cvel_25903.t1-p1 / transcript=Cvel_25903.t1 / gene=Cvel_25903 / organism=Chromera_velia_CCMP2878 / gene_product=hypothetical protein / transcript_product=hypothetical protein / location=Cvel_scaffold2993:3838-4552(-) / protein_length=205 / sequence_SO=supercontig / SO=protein_coding / is_pseudo=false